MTKRSLRAEDAVIIYLIAFLAYQIFGVILHAVMPTDSDAYIFLAYAIPQLCYIIVATVYILAVKGEFRFLPHKTEIKLSHYGIALLLGAGVFFFALLPNYGMQLLFAKLGKNPTVTVPDLHGGGNIVLALLIICILPAVGEELIFRKLFCDCFSAYGNLAAILISGVLFGLGHLNLAQTVHQVFLGCVLAYLYIKTKNITLTCVIHFLNNVLALFLSEFTAQGLWSNLTVLGICFAVGAVATAGSLALLYKTAPKLELKKGSGKPSILVYAFFAIIFVLWLVTAIVA